jgi:hypothetical protein
MKVLLAFVLAALLVPAVALARPSSSDVTINASRQCSALRGEIGNSEFGATFSSFAGCVVKLTPLEQRNTAAAGTLCRVRFPAASSPTRLFESCVVAFAKSSSLTEQRSLDPAQTCTSLRSSMGTAAFAGKYSGGGNAFGTCVSTTAGVQLEAETSAASTCRSEQAAAGFVSTHGGKTFARFYGTNTADSNAFGRCVSLKAQAQISSQVGQASSTTTTPTTTTTPMSTDPCTGGSGKPNRLMPNDCLPATSR